MEQPIHYIAIGDIHGLAKTLDSLLAKLPPTGRLVFLGDYIDRGPDSKGVIARLLTLEQQRDCVFLRGNHEAMAIKAYDGDADAEAAWQYNGGYQTLISYQYLIPDAHLDFLRRTRPYYATDDYIFVHGGLVPGLQPDEMEEERLWWMREPFLSSDYDWGRLVIHGHTPTGRDTPEIHRHRINLDTAAVYGGRLTALLLPKRKFISVKAQG